MVYHLNIIWSFEFIHSFICHLKYVCVCHLLIDSYITYINIRFNCAFVLLCLFLFQVAVVNMFPCPLFFTPLFIQFISIHFLSIWLHAKIVRIVCHRMKSLTHTHTWAELNIKEIKSRCESEREQSCTKIWKMHNQCLVWFCFLLVKPFQSNTNRTY